MIVYHGSNVVVQNPDLVHSRKMIDFGRGFYLTEDYEMACKWVSDKQQGIINKYELDLTDLRVIRLGLSDVWLEYVSFNRGFGNTTFDESNVDVVIGATANDKLFRTLQYYWDNVLTPEKTIKCLNVMGFSPQIVLKTPNAIKSLRFIEYQRLSSQEMSMWFNAAQNDRVTASKKLEQYLAKIQSKSSEIEIRPKIRKLEDYSQDLER